MLSLENVSSIRDLVDGAAKVYNGKCYLRYLENDEIKDITFDQFADGCKSIAAWVYEQSQKVGHPIRVAMLSPNNPLFVLMLLGVAYGGGVSIPMDPQMDAKTLCACLNKAEADVLILEPSIAIDKDLVTENCPKVYDIMSMSKGEYPNCTYIIDQYKGKKKFLSVSEKDCALIIFTSGTTGEEKGVMLSNLNLVDNVFCKEHEYNNVKLNILPMHHAFCLNADILTNFVNGAITCMNGDTSKLGENLTRFKPNLLTMVPMVAQALYNKTLMLSKEHNVSIKALVPKVFGPNVKKIVAGGAHLPAELVAKYREIGIYLCQGYGMTECSPVISAPIYDRPDKAHTAGKVVYRCQTRVVRGELQVKSPSVMMGYVNAPELTAEVITPDGWLRTGDIGMEDEEGFLHITGRKKNLIILSNGANVSPEQIENLILDREIVKETLVYGEGNTIVAEVYPDYKYVRLNNILDVREEIEKVIAEVNAPLPSYKKIMKLIIRKVEFERTGSNKIKRNQRASKDAIFTSNAPKNKRPNNDLQMKIFNVIAEVLGHKDFGIDTDIFAAGLNSLGCVLALTSFSENMDFYIELDELMKCNTIEKLEKLYIEKSSTDNIDLTPREVYPLTKVQQYFAYIIRGNTTSNIPALFKLDSSIDLDKMKSAIIKLFDIHPILKCVIQPTEKGYAAFRNDAKDVNIPIYKMPKEQWEQVQKDLIHPYMYTQNEPLYHIGLYYVDGEKYLFFDIAHIISDGATLGILFDHLSRLYKGEVVKDRKFTFYDYVLDDAYRTENGLVTTNYDYFVNLMGDFKIKKTILNRKGHQDMSKAVNAAIHSKFNSINKEKIKKFCTKHGVSENVLFLTAFNMCISIFSDEDDTLSTSIHNGRTDSRWGRVAGCFFMTYNFRCKFNKKHSVNKTLGDSAKQIMNTMCCRVNNLHADEMFFQYQGDLLDFNSIGGAPIERIPLQLDSLPFHLMVHLSGENYKYELRYWKNRFEKKQLMVFMEVMDAMLSAMMEYDVLGDVRKYLPKHLIPGTLDFSTNVINKEAGAVLADYNKTVKIRIVDRNGNPQPVGAWGSLYISGKKTDKVARIMTDGSIDFLHNSGRNVMIETLAGRFYPDLNQLEQTLLTCAGVDTAQAYSSYTPDNQLRLTVDVTGSEDLTRDGIVSYLEGVFQKYMVPTVVKINGKTV